MTQIGTNIKKLRSVKGLSQQAFAELFSLTRGNISSYEEFRAEPKISVILQIAKYFGIPVAHLLEKKLTVNEILNFEDHFAEDSNSANVKNMDPIPLLNRAVLQKSGENTIELDRLPIFYFPLAIKNEVLAVEHNGLIHHPAAFPFEEHSILFFEKLQIDILHTLDKHYGFYIKENDFFFGKFEVHGKDIDLWLNDWKKATVTAEEMGCFWKLHAKYERVI
ncbi:helix-turn-helix domain-containing protein [Sphingobacterium sp. DK4209]|uniref:Helix-turn-helix domain-containing protein n=1 Tax=Sphingobacterium zhuxiongii TaxID=2662364 RepID=A0A5Q0QAI1_9SPHI|nr:MULTISPECIES: helix-turn-helix transcriptional regulator [unclassified Sphingobacterium]MVZ66154.1 helix-turn-helix domain-containing protein [Sphingobacterium sp. DK4209]QGA26573.1 helix-turn-helix domain-containing protein [Sphingobacterium sp. dk4302]